MKTTKFLSYATALCICMLCGCSSEDDTFGPNSVPFEVFPSGTHFDTYTISSAGSLPDLIPADKKFTISALKIKGPINGTDIRFIREMAGRDVEGNEVTEAALNYLDLSEAYIVEGGQYYYKHYETEDNVIGYSMFHACNHLKAVALPNSITTIEQSAFEYCSSLTNITLPNSITTIEQSAFSRCSSLTNINLPNSLTYIGRWAFWECTSLTDIYSHIKNPDAVTLEMKYLQVTLYVPIGTLQSYLNNDSWNSSFGQILEGDYRD